MMFVVALSQGIKETQAELSLCTVCYCQIRQNSWSSTGHILVHLQTQSEQVSMRFVKVDM